jgi:hypothetical protein
MLLYWLFPKGPACENLATLAGRALLLLKLLDQAAAFSSSSARK